jgi:hypothetical protein
MVYLLDAWVNYWRKFTDSERAACTDQYTQLNLHISQKHQIKRYKSTEPVEEWGKIDLNDFGKFRLIGQPLVSVNSAHSGDDKGNPPATAVDIGPLGTTPTAVINTAAQNVGMWRPCDGDIIHFQLRRTPCAAQSLSIQSDPPFKLLVTDPLGRRIGFDSTTKTVINEIGPAAFYTGFDTGLTQFIDIGGSLPGAYLIQPVDVTGGTYDLSILRLNEDTDILASQSASGIASQNQVISPITISVPWQAEIDIKPGDSTNATNPRSRGNIPVAIMSTPQFDARTINPPSLSFGRTGDEKTFDVCHVEDIDKDGLQDLVCHFETQGTGFGSGDSEGILKGLTVDGTPVIGRDSVRIVP